MEIIMRTLFLALASLFISTPAISNVIGSDAQNFAPTPDGLDFVTVHSSETLEPGILNIGFFINYAQNTFPAFEGSGSAPAQSFLDKNDSLTSADFNFAVGIVENLQIGASFPYIIDQTVEDTTNIGQFQGTGTSEIRPMIKYHFYDTEKWGFAVIGSANFNLIENNPYVGEDPGATFNIEVAADRNFGKWNWGVNLGRRWRSPGDEIASTGIDPLPDQIIYSSALSYLLKDIDTKVIGEIYGSSPQESTPNLSNRQNSSLEALVGAKHDFTRNIALHAGLGTELGQGTSTPDWRIYSGVNIVFGPLFGQKDPIQKVRIKKIVRLTLNNLQFEFNSDELTPQSKQLIDQLIAKVKEHGRFKKITIVGHTDSIGSVEYNQKLSERRALAIKNILVKKLPVAPSKVVAKGAGETQPIADNGNYQGREKNRRVEFNIE